MTDLAAMLQATGRFLLETHEHEAQPDEAQPWRLRRAPAWPACGELRAALGLEPVSVETPA